MVKFHRWSNGCTVTANPAQMAKTIGWMGERMAVWGDRAAQIGKHIWWEEITSVSGDSINFNDARQASSKLAVRPPVYNTKYLFNVPRGFASFAYFFSLRRFYTFLMHTRRSTRCHTLFSLQVIFRWWRCTKLVSFISNVAMTTFLWLACW